MIAIEGRMGRREATDTAELRALAEVERLAEGFENTDEAEPISDDERREVLSRCGRADR